MPLEKLMSVAHRGHHMFRRTHPMKKLSFVLGAAVGYVLGTRAGRARYEQIAAQAQKLWQSEPVQARVDEAGEEIRRLAPKLGTLTVEGVKQVQSLVKKKTSKGAEAPSGTVGNPAE